MRLSYFLDIKKKNAQRTFGIAAITAVLFMLASASVFVRTLALQQLLASAAGVFIFSLAALIVLGAILGIIGRNLTGKGGFAEGFAAASYSFLPIAAAALVAALFMLVPYGLFASVLVAALGFAYGFSTMFRAIRQLFAADMVTAFASVFIMLITIFAALYFSAAISLLTNVGYMVGA